MGEGWTEREAAGAVAFVLWEAVVVIEIVRHVWPVLWLPIWVVWSHGFLMVLSLVLDEDV